MNLEIQILAISDEIGSVSGPMPDFRAEAEMAHTGSTRGVRFWARGSSDSTKWVRSAEQVDRVRMALRSQPVSSVNPLAIVRKVSAEPHT